MPTLLIAARLTQHSYDTDMDLPLGWKKLMCSDQLLKGSIERFGYFGQALINEEENTIVIIHRGTHLSTACAIENVQISASNLISDSMIASHSTPFETELALDFTAFVVDTYQKENCRFIQIGHSLGGFHAHLCGYEFNHSVISFDSPPCGKQFTNQEYINREKLRQHYTFLSDPNLINDPNVTSYTNHQVGRVFQLVEHIEANALVDRLLATPKTHFLEYIIARLPEEVEDPTLDYHEIISQYFSVKDYLFEQEVSGKNELEHIDILEKDEFIRANIPLLTETPHPGGRVRVSVSSRLTSSLIVEQDLWVVSHINSGSVFTGHSIIVVEGLKSEENEPNKYNLFVGYYHLVVPPGSKMSCVLAQEYDYHRFSKHYNSSQTRSWTCVRDKVEKMIENIQLELGKELPYHFAGNRTLIYPNDKAHNCTSWAIEKLKIAEFDITRKATDYFKTKPGIYTANSPNAALFNNQNHTNDKDLPTSTWDQCLIM